MAAFPSLTPTARRFTPGIYPQRSYRTLSGIVARRTFGSSPYAAKLELEYSNVSGSVVTAILDHYHRQTSRNARFRLSSSVSAGMSNGPTSEIVDRGNFRWEYEQPPQVESVLRDLYTISVSLLGEIRDPRTDDA